MALCPLLSFVVARYAGYRAGCNRRRGFAPDPTRGAALYLAVASRGVGWEAAVGWEPVSALGDRARSRARRPIQRFHPEPAQSPGPHSEPAFARTGHGT